MHPDGIGISVVVPCYTAERIDSIRAALESLRKQTLQPEQVVVAVDNNTDLARLLREHFDWVSVVENTACRGASATRNRGVEAVASEFTAFLDDDETAVPEWLSELSRPFADGYVVGTGGAYEAVWETGKPDWFPDEFGWAVGSAYLGLPTETAPIRNVWSGNMAVRTAAFREVGGFRTDFGKLGAASQPEDTDLCIRMAEASSGTWMYVPSAVIQHEVPAGRSGLNFFVRRCFSEGAGKAAMRANLDGSAVSAEHGYVLATALAALRRLTAIAKPRVLLQGLVMLLGLASAAVGYALGLARCRKAPESPPEDTRRPATVLDVDLTEDPVVFVGKLRGIDRYRRVWMLVRDRGRPVEAVELEADPAQLRDYLANYIAPESHRPEPLADPTGVVGEPLIITVVICTHERPQGVRRALESLTQQTRADFGVLVIDNAPTSKATADVVEAMRGRLPALRYMMEPVPGLSQARNRALRYVETEYIAWIDDDETADTHWVSELLDGFACHPEADAISGSVVPAELETKAQWWFEQYGGHSKGRGFTRAVFRGGKAAQQSPLYPLPAFGAGANMAVRTSAVREIGGFDVALGAGTPTAGGEDTLMFSQLLLAGSTVVYQPSALTRHYHRRDLAALEKQMHSYGVGLTAYYVALLRSDWRLVLPLFGLLPRGLVDMFGGDRSTATNGLPSDFPPRLLWLKRRGLVLGPLAYLRGRRAAARRRVSR